MIDFTTGVAFLLASMYGGGATTAVATASQGFSNVNTDASAKKSTIILQDRKAVEKYLREQYADTPILVEIARCESEFSQFDKDGNVVRGIVNKADVGVMQINEKYHADAAEALGLNLHTIEGNVAYAKYLYSKEGSTPWKYSSKCWNKKNVS